MSSQVRAQSRRGALRISHLSTITRPGPSVAVRGTGSIDTTPHNCSQISQHIPGEQRILDADINIVQISKSRYLFAFHTTMDKKCKHNSRQNSGYCLPCYLPSSVTFANIRDNRAGRGAQFSCILVTHTVTRYAIVSLALQNIFNLCSKYFHAKNIFPEAVVVDVVEAPLTLIINDDTSKYQVYH